MQFSEKLALQGRDVTPIERSPAGALDTPSEDLEEGIPPGLERYIRVSVFYISLIILLNEYIERSCLHLHQM